MVYLASYPKSGNTWLRIFLGYLQKGEELDINKLGEFSKITSSRTLFESIIGENSYELTETEISYYRPKMIDYFVKEQDEPIVYLKSHEAYIKNEQGNWLLPQKPNYKAIYLVRNPLDVCVSYAHHGGHADYHKTIKFMSGHPKLTKGRNNQFPHYIGSWSENIESWLENFSNDRLLVIRFEDMQLNSLDTFSKIVDFIGLNYSTRQIEAAIELSSFERLQDIENKSPFSEKPIKSKRFFRNGKIGEGQEILSDEQQAKIIQNHKKMMLKFNYL